jgi:hypothetical protein
LNIGAAGASQATEKYDYDPITGLLAGQKVFRGAETTQSTILNLDYNYLREGTTTGRSGQLTQLIDNRDHSKDRSFQYDPLSRLQRASSGSSAGSWVQRYLYDRFGNRLATRSLRSDQFLANLFSSLWNRAPDSSTLQSQNNLLRQAFAQGQSQLLEAAKAAVASFLDASQYQSRVRTDREYVYDLYKAYLNREPDAGGWEGWTAAIAGSGRLAVRQGFARSGEFATLVSAIYPGATGGTASVSAPSNLAVTISVSTQVSLSWTAAVTAPDHYQVERSQNNSGAYTAIGSTSGSSYTDSSVSSGAAYLYRVRAVASSSSATSEASNVALGTAVTFTEEG